MSLPALVLAAALGATAALGTTAASAQATPPAAPGPGALPADRVGGTVSGDFPDKTGSTTAVGQTKPPGATVGDGLGTRPDLEEKSRDLDRKIRTGICQGCN